MIVTLGACEINLWLRFEVVLESRAAPATLVMEASRAKQLLVIVNRQVAQFANVEFRASMLRKIRTSQTSGFLFEAFLRDDRRPATHRGAA